MKKIAVVFGTKRVVEGDIVVTGVSQGGDNQSCEGVRSCVNVIGTKLE